MDPGSANEPRDQRRGPERGRWTSWAQSAGRDDIDVADQVSVAHRDLDMGSLAEERARERRCSLGKHAACGTNPDACPLEHRNHELDDHAVKPVSSTRLAGQRKTLLAAEAEHLVVRLRE